MTLRPETLGPDDFLDARELGVSVSALDDAMCICATFNIIDRLADALGFDLLTHHQYSKNAGHLLKYGYAIPSPLRRQ